jgi:GT2 family glycosyltransferase
MTIRSLIILYDTPRSEVEGITYQFKQFGPVALVDAKKKRYGYAEAINSFIEPWKKREDVLLVANPDIDVKSVHKKDIESLMDKYDIGGFTMRQEEGIYYGGQIDRWRMSGGLIRKKPRSRYTPVDFVSGSFMVIKTSVFDTVGLFNEAYGMYYEDVEFCYRARQKGLRVGIDSATSYIHFEVSKANRKKAFYLFRNRLLFLIRYGSIAQILREIVRIPKTVLELVGI